MQFSRNILIATTVIVCVVSGIIPNYHAENDFALGQTSKFNSRQNSTPAPVFKFRDRRNLQTTTPQNRSTQFQITQRTSPGSWPGSPPSSLGHPRSTSKRYSGNTSPIQQTVAVNSYQLPPTGPVMLGTHRKRIRDYSWIYIDTPVPLEIKLHDIVTIIVDEKSEVIMNSRFNRQRMSKLKAELKEFVRLGNRGNLINAAVNAPTIDAQLQGQLNSTGQLTDQEGIKYRIAATVVAVLPNGVLQLEAKKKIQTQDDVSEYTLTGELRASDVAPDNTASSENIASLNIVKNQNGRVYDSTKRNWGYRLYDLLSPF